MILLCRFYTLLSPCEQNCHSTLICDESYKKDDTTEYSLHFIVGGRRYEESKLEGKTNHERAQTCRCKIKDTREGERSDGACRGMLSMWGYLMIQFQWTWAQAKGFVFSPRTPKGLRDHLWPITTPFLAKRPLHFCGFREFPDKLLRGLISNLLETFIIGLIWSDWRLITLRWIPYGTPQAWLTLKLRWIPTVSWPLIGSTVSAYLQTNRWSSELILRLPRLINCWSRSAEFPPFHSLWFVERLPWTFLHTNCWSDSARDVPPVHMGLSRTEHCWIAAMICLILNRMHRRTLWITIKQLCLNDIKLPQTKRSPTTSNNHLNLVKNSTTLWATRPADLPATSCRANTKNSSLHTWWDCCVRPGGILKRFFAHESTWIRWDFIWF